MYAYALVSPIPARSGLIYVAASVHSLFHFKLRHYPATGGFASGAVYLVSSGLMSACEFGSKLGSRDMNERKAFGWAVRSLRLYDWNPAVPDKPRFQVNADSLTFREICERAKKFDEPLPEVIKYDLYPLLGRAPDLQAKLRLNETYSVAATCLLEFLDEDRPI